MTGKRCANRLQAVLRTLKIGLLGMGVMVLASCGGGSSSSGTPPPLPTGQIGSLNNANSTLANCYISDTTTCASPSPVGTNAITALAAGTINSTNTLYWGDGGGNIYSSSSLTVTPPTISNSTSCFTSPLSKKILALTTLSGTSTGSLFYSISGGTYQITGLSSTGQCSTSTTKTSVSLLTGALAYNSSTGLVVGVTTSSQYFTCNTSTTPAGCTSQGTLTGLVDTSPTATAIASDPNYPLVYILSIGSNYSRIYYYLVNSNGTLTSLGNYTGTELVNPAGIAAFSGNTGTQSFCTTGPCTFLYVTNGNTTITQYVLTYSFSGTTPTGVSINQFNNSYFNCDLIAPAAIAAIPSTGTSGTLNEPYAFVGENGIQSGPCLGVTSSAQYGNNITAYTIQGE